MATITLAAAANWSTCNSGSPPGAGDTIYLGAFALTLDGADAATYTCVLIAARAADGTTSTAGTIVLGAATTFNINANLTAGTVPMLTVASGKHVAFPKTVTGGTATSAACVKAESGGTVDSCLEAIGGSGKWAYGISGLPGAVITEVTTTRGGAYNDATATGYDYSIDTAAGVLADDSIVGHIENALGSDVSSSPGVILSDGTLGTITIELCQGGAATNSRGLFSAISGLATLTVNHAYGGSGDYSLGIYADAAITLINHAKGGTGNFAHGAVAGHAGELQHVVLAEGGDSMESEGACGVFATTGAGEILLVDSAVGGAGYKCHGAAIDLANGGSLAVVSLATGGTGYGAVGASCTRGATTLASVVGGAGTDGCFGVLIGVGATVTVLASKGGAGSPGIGFFDADDARTLKLASTDNTEATASVQTTAFSIADDVRLLCKNYAGTATEEWGKTSDVEAAKFAADVNILESNKDEMIQTNTDLQAVFGAGVEGTADCSGGGISVEYGQDIMLSTSNTNINNGGITILNSSKPFSDSDTSYINENIPPLSIVSGKYSHRFKRNT